MPHEYLVHVEGMWCSGCPKAIVNRLASDQRFTLEFDYQGDYIPNPCRVVLLDDDVTLEEVAEKMYSVAQHAVLHEGRYIVGSEADRERHRK